MARTLKRKRTHLSSVRLYVALALLLFVIGTIFIALQVEDDATAAASAGSVKVQRPALPKNDSSPLGAIILGMHRSGTSLLTGLLVEGFGYNVGKPLLQASGENAKGYYERRDVVLENMSLLKQQQAHWNRNVDGFQPKQSKLSQRGKRALKFFNSPANAPWLLKDPRLCITLPTWVDRMAKPAAIVFTYRHPLQTAFSLHERSMSLEDGMKLWLVYNQRAIQYSRALCRVVTSNNAILHNPLQEAMRISSELTNKCHVPSPPKKIAQQVVDTFVDPSLQHYNKDARETQVLLKYKECDIYNYARNVTIERDVYIKAMKVYCDLQNGAAFQSNYEWPD